MTALVESLVDDVCALCVILPTDLNQPASAMRRYSAGSQSMIIEAADNSQKQRIELQARFVLDTQATPWVETLACDCGLAFVRFKLPMTPFGHLYRGWNLHGG